MSIYILRAKTSIELNSCHHRYSLREISFGCPEYTFGTIVEGVESDETLGGAAWTYDYLPASCWCDYIPQRAPSRMNVYIVAGNSVDESCSAETIQIVIVQTFRKYCFHGILLPGYRQRNHIEIESVQHSKRETADTLLMYSAFCDEDKLIWTALSIALMKTADFRYTAGDQR